MKAQKRDPEKTSEIIPPVTVPDNPPKGPQIDPPKDPVLPENPPEIEPGKSIPERSKY